LVKAIEAEIKVGIKRFLNVLNIKNIFLNLYSGINK